MTTEQSNPFVLPGFGQSGDSAQNPVFAGMEMMRKAWQGMAGAGVSGFESAGMPIMSIEDLERRIGELQAVESWLRLNLSMLSNTIQGLEIQRSTMATLRSFAAQGMPEGFGAPQAASPRAAAPASEAGKAADTQPYAQAAEDWWNLVQQQFQSLAAATAATLQNAHEGAAAAATASDAAPRRASGARPAAGSAAKPAAKAAKPASKSTRKATTKRPVRRPS